MLGIYDPLPSRKSQLRSYDGYKDLVRLLTPTSKVPTYHSHLDKRGIPKRKSI